MFKMFISVFTAKFENTFWGISRVAPPPGNLSDELSALLVLETAY